MLAIICLLLMGLSLSTGAQAASWKKGPLIISGAGARTLWVCNDQNMLPCWFSRPDSYCELPIDSVYRVSKKKLKTEIVIKGVMAKIINDITKDCYDAEPEDRQELRYYWGNQGVQCKVKKLRMRCRVTVDAYYPDAAKKLKPVESLP